MEQRIDVNKLLGTVVASKYILVRVLGVGGMGAVFEAEHLVTHRRVALKLIHSWIVASFPNAAARFMREAEAPSRLHHPAIVEVLDAGKDDSGSLYLAFEFLEGEDLETALKRGGVNSRDIIEIAIELLDVLEVAHAAGLIHRDIKPANIFLTRDPDTGKRNIKLLDFGIAKRLDEHEHEHFGLTTQGAILGTLEYMSPEQALCEQVDGRADLWSVGAMLYRAFAGRPAVAATNMVKLAVKLATEETPSLAVACPDLSPALIAAIDRAMLKNRSARFANAAEMRAALELALNGQRTAELRPASDTKTAQPTVIVRDRSLPPAKAPSQLQPPAKKKRAPAWIAVSVLIFGTGAIFLSREADEKTAELVAVAPALEEPPTKTATVTAAAEVVETPAPEKSPKARKRRTPALKKTPAPAPATESSVPDWQQPKREYK